MHLPDNGSHPNALGLSDHDLKLRKVELIDVLTLGHALKDAEYDAK